MNMYVVKLDEPAVVCLTSAVKPKTNQLQLWHKRLCHENKKYVQEFLQQDGSQCAS